MPVLPALSDADPLHRYASLAARLLLPGLAQLIHAGQVPDDLRVVASARSDMDTDAYRGDIAEKLVTLAPHVPQSARDALVERIDYLAVDVTNPEAHAFYKREGFIEDRVEVIMRKPLDGVVRTSEYGHGAP